LYTPVNSTGRCGSKSTFKGKYSSIDDDETKLLKAEQVNEPLKQT
jgi:hypothetical protein